MENVPLTLKRSTKYLFRKTSKQAAFEGAKPAQTETGFSHL